MSLPQQLPTMKGNLALFLALLAGFAVGYFSAGITGYLSSLGAEYNSASAIREITRFVEQNERWPISWSDLGVQPLDGVEINWSVNISTCDRYDVMTSVMPITRGFYTYPHAEQQLRELWKLVSKIQNERSHSGTERVPQ